MSINIGNRVPGRFIDLPGGTKAFLIACGNTPCSANRFAGRFIDYKNGEEVYAILSECFSQPTDIPGHPDNAVHFVAQDIWPPTGITDVVALKFDVGLPTSCWSQPDTTCPIVYLFWDGTKYVGDLVGDAGTIHIELRPDGGPDPDHPGYPVWQVYFSNCISPIHIQAMHTLCIFPFQLNSESDGFLIPAACCDVTFLSGPISVKGFTQRRHLARLIDYRNGTPVYEFGTCCPSDKCGVPCCECAASPVEWTFGVAGVLPTPPSPPQNCPCANATYTIVFSGVHSGVCAWTSLAGPGCGQWILRCFNDTRKWVLEFSGGESAGAATYELGFDAWNCMGPNVMNFVSASPCLGWPETLTLTAA